METAIIEDVAILLHDYLTVVTNYSHRQGGFLNFQGVNGVPWLLKHPIPMSSKQFTRFLVCLPTVFEASFTPKYIQFGFYKTGIYSFRENLLIDDDI